jgi:hypothetical protein
VLPEAEDVSGQVYRSCLTRGLRLRRGQQDRGEADTDTARPQPDSARCTGASLAEAQVRAATGTPGWQ